ncbi:MAG: hypothetical protein ACM3ML_25420 [Micromonosporaceae bacterium]
MSRAVMSRAVMSRAVRPGTVRPGRRQTARAAAAAALTCIAALAAACSGGGAPAAQGPSGPAQASTAGSASANGGFQSLKVLAVRYLAIAKDPNRHLDVDFDGLEKSDHRNLALAQSQLRDMAATERRFDRLLLAIRFPPKIEATAHVLVRTNENRAALATRAAASHTLKQLRGYEQQLSAANGPLEDAVRMIRKQLGLPPPDTS